MVWYKNLDNDPEYIAEELKYTFAIEVEKIMQSAGITKSQLATQLSTSPAYITKVLRGDANLTIETMVKLAYSIGGQVRIHIVSREQEQAEVKQWTGVAHLISDSENNLQNEEDRQVASESSIPIQISQYHVA